MMPFKCTKCQSEKPAITTAFSVVNSSLKTIFVFGACKEVKTTAEI